MEDESLSRNELGPFGKLVEPLHIGDAIARAMDAVDARAKLLAWTGLPGRGKTITAMRLIDHLKGMYPDSHTAATYLQLAGRDGGSTAGQQLGIYNVYAPILRPLTPAAQRAKQADGMAKEVVEHCRLHGTRLLVLDEAGTQSAEQLRGITQIADVARQQAVPLTLLFVGMDELAAKLHTKAQVHRRIAEWEVFENWSRTDLEALVYAHAPSLASRRNELGMIPVMDLLVAQGGGCLGRVSQTASLLEQRLRSFETPRGISEVLQHTKRLIADALRRRPKFGA